MAARNRKAEFKYTHNFIDALFAEDMHAKRVDSLANATLGVMTSASLAVSTIGHGLALARGRLNKHAIKQVDRLLSNPGIDVRESFMRWVPYMLGARKCVDVAMDWTDFDADNQATIMLSLITRHGRTTPLVWLSVDKATLKDNRNRYEYQVLVWLAEAIPADVKVLIVADRGFGDHKLYKVLTEELKFDYLIRFRGNIKVTAVDGEARMAVDWVGQGGRTRILRGVAVTAEGYPVGAVVCVQAKDMKQPWCLATSLSDEKAGSLLKKYAKRWGIECSFRDTKDLRSCSASALRRSATSAPSSSTPRRTMLGRPTRSPAAYPGRSPAASRSPATMYAASSITVSIRTRRAGSSMTVPGRSSPGAGLRSTTASPCRTAC